MPKQGKTPKKKSKEKTPQKSGESEYPAMDQEEFNRLFQNAIEQSQAQLQQTHASEGKSPNGWFKLPRRRRRARAVSRPHRAPAFRPIVHISR